MNDIEKNDISIEEVISTLKTVDQVDLNEQHLFIEGVYARHGVLPAGSLIVGHVHKKEAINIMASGKILIKTKMEEDWTEISAPFINKTPGGMRKIIYVLEDAMFINVFRTDNTDMDELYKECVEPEEGSKPYLEAYAAWVEKNSNQIN